MDVAMANFTASAIDGGSSVLEGLKEYGLLDWKVVVPLAVLTYILYEQLSIQAKKKWLPGPVAVVPFLGTAIDMVAAPTKYWDDQARAASKTGLSWNFLLGRYMVFIRDSELSQKVFANVSPDAFHLIGHPFGKKLFGEKNMIMMFGDEHKSLRRRLAPLFQLKALGVYIDIQEQAIRKHIGLWLKEAAASPDAMPMRIRIRDMNLETSQSVFAGPYLTPEVRKQFTEDYRLFNEGLLALPIGLPGFSFWKATKAVPRIIAVLGDCARQSKERMMGGYEPTCLMDFWMIETVREIREAEEAGLPPPPHSSDHDIGQHVFDFLFAAQDASTSSLVWSLTLLDGHPEVLAKMRAELKAVYGPDNTRPYTHELMRSLPYTEMVMKEILRFRPPAPLVPHISSVDFPLTPDYTIPKGTIVFPSLLESSFQGFVDANKFDPERFNEKRREDQVYRRNWLLFGAGPHQCLGQKYAMNHIMLFISLMATLVDWQRVQSPNMDDLEYVPTIVPKDGAMIHLKPLAWRTA